MEGTDLRAWRLAHGWTQREAGNVLGGYSPSTYNLWECGRRRVPPYVAEGCAGLPSPPTTDEYPLTPAGLRRALADRGYTRRAFTQVWGVTSASLYRYLSGASPLPVRLQAWLARGACGEIAPRPPEQRGRHSRKPRPHLVDGACLRAWRLARGWSALDLEPIFAFTKAALYRWETNRCPAPPEVVAWWQALPPLPPEPLYPPTPWGLQAVLGQRGRGATWLALQLGVSVDTVWAWRRGAVGMPLRVQTWLACGAPRRWWPPDPPPMRAPGQYVAPPPPRRPPAHPPPEGHWVRVPHRQGLAPPAGYCNPERDALTLAGCKGCCYRRDCRELVACR